MYSTWRGNYMDSSYQCCKTIVEAKKSCCGMNNVNYFTSNFSRTY